jgi:hypothetical protein
MRLGGDGASAGDGDVGEEMTHMHAELPNQEALRASRRKLQQEERARQIQQRMADEDARHKAMDAKTLRLRELRMARDAAEHEASAAAAKAPAPAKTSRRSGSASKTRKSR